MCLCQICYDVFTCECEYKYVKCVCVCIYICLCMFTWQVVGHILVRRHVYVHMRSCAYTNTHTQAQHQIECLTHQMPCFKIELYIINMFTVLHQVGNRVSGSSDYFTTCTRHSPAGDRDTNTIRCRVWTAHMHTHTHTRTHNHCCRLLGASHVDAPASLLRAWTAGVELDAEQKSADRHITEVISALKNGKQFDCPVCRKCFDPAYPSAHQYCLQNHLRQPCEAACIYILRSCIVMRQVPRMFLHALKLTRDAILKSSPGMPSISTCLHENENVQMLLGMFGLSWGLGLFRSPCFPSRHLESYIWPPLQSLCTVHFSVSTYTHTHASSLSMSCFNMPRACVTRGIQKQIKT
jgi:hypothetical protein